MMDKRSTKIMRVRRIQQLLEELGVDKCISTKLKALSGGERKRVSLAVQVIIKILFSVKVKVLVTHFLIEEQHIETT